VSVANCLKSNSGPCCGKQETTITIAAVVHRLLLPLARNLIKPLSCIWTAAAIGRRAGIPLKVNAIGTCRFILRHSSTCSTGLPHLFRPKTRHVVRWCTTPPEAVGE
jgi:hypothetical protein